MREVFRNRDPDCADLGPHVLCDVWRPRLQWWDRTSLLQHEQRKNQKSYDGGNAH